MHADDTNYTVIKNGVVVVSGTGPAVRVDGNRLVIRDGPQETPPLVLTRAEASRKLRHVIVCGHAGGLVTFDAVPIGQLFAGRKSSFAAASYRKPP